MRPYEAIINARRNVANVKQRLVTEVNRFLMEHFSRNHAKRDEVPRRPQILPFFPGGNIASETWRDDGEARGMGQGQEYN